MTPYPPVYVAGVGVISAIGNNASECIESLENSRAGLDSMQYLHSFYKGKLPVGEVKLTNLELARLSGLSAYSTRTAMLSAVAAKEALHGASIENFKDLRTGFISANTIGGMDKTEVFFEDYAKDARKGHLRDVVHHECGSTTETVADLLGITGYISTISTACSSSANAIAFAARLIRHNILDAAVAGGADGLARFTLNGFNTLMILDHSYCQPFDEHRRGLNLGEGAGYVVLVSERVAQEMRQPLVCLLGGFANANDAYHQTASSPTGMGSYLAMSGALKQASLLPSDISYINLHGTGTQNNDLSEGLAIKNLFDPAYPKMSSTKSFTGHTLGASGGMEAVFSVLSVAKGLIYPNLRLTDPMKELPYVPETTFQRNASVKHVLSNSFGFGGNCSSLIFSKI